MTIKPLLKGIPWVAGGVEFTHKVKDVSGHPYFVGCVPVVDEQGRVVSMKWWNPDTSRVCTMKPDKSGYIEKATLL